MVQQIHASYLKDGRGGEQARRRAMMPSSLALPAWSGQPGYVCHDVVASAPDFCSLRPTLDTGAAPPRHGRFLRFDDGIHWRGGVVGMPPRSDQPVNLEGRAWIQIRANGRTNDWHYGEFSLWRYIDVTINIGRFETPPSEEVFVATTPDRVMDLRAPLW